MKTDVPSSTTSQIRCAIYTRKSTDEGLDQDFNSLDAQREAAEAFIRSQRGEGLVALPERYDDGGFSGGNRTGPLWNGSWPTFADGRSTAWSSTRWTG